MLVCSVCGPAGPCAQVCICVLCACLNNVSRKIELFSVKDLYAPFLFVFSPKIT